MYVTHLDLSRLYLTTCRLQICTVFCVYCLSCVFVV